MLLYYYYVRSLYILNLVYLCKKLYTQFITTPMYSSLRSVQTVQTMLALYYLTNLKRLVQPLFLNVLITL